MLRRGKNKMATNHKRTGLYVTAGIAIAVVIIAAILASGVKLPFENGSQNTGTLFVSITDAPANLTNLNVTLSTMYVHNDDNDSWIQLGFTGGVTKVYFDLLALNNVTKELSTSAIPVGNYSKIRLSIESANATFADGTVMNLTVPPEHIDVIVSFQINSGQGTDLLIEMQADTAAISQSGNLKPVLKATIQ
jgi:hypothetical protein